MELQDLVAKAYKLRVEKELIELAELRMVKALADAGAKHNQFARGLGIRQSDIPKKIQEANEVEPIRAGFSSGSPYEICQRYYIGELTRAQAIDELVRWEYKPQAKGEEWDPWGMEGGAPEVPGSWDDMNTAKTHKLIDYDFYTEVGDKIDAKAQATPEG